MIMMCYRCYSVNHTFIVRVHFSNDCAISLLLLAVNFDPIAAAFTSLRIVCPALCAPVPCPQCKLNSQ